MEFNKKLQELRKQNGLTQEELAEHLFVSRTAVSKWESGRGYPNLDSLKEISRFFGISIDDLLSGDELLTAAEEDNKQKEKQIRSLVFGLLDLSTAMFFFLPFFGQTVDGILQEVSLLALNEIALYLRTAYFVVVIGIILWGVLTLALQSILGEKQKQSVVNVKYNRYTSLYHQFATVCCHLSIYVLGNKGVNAY